MTDLLALLDTLDGLHKAATDSTRFHATKRYDFGESAYALWPELSTALRTALTPTTDGEREAREWVARFDLDRPMYAGDFALCPSHLRTTLNLLAAERAKAADAAREQEPWVCDCGLPMSRNPHPDAGKPAALLNVGAVWVCIPCTVKSRHGATTARFQAERDRDGERAAIVARVQAVVDTLTSNDTYNVGRRDALTWLIRELSPKVTP